MRVVYAPQHDLGFPGLRHLHHFEGDKFSQAWRLIEEAHGEAATRSLTATDRPATSRELELVHSPEYIQRATHSSELAGIVELPWLRFVPRWLTRRSIIEPMKWATRATMLAATLSLEAGLAVNLGGGFHHAKRDSGEGFCVWNDIACAFESLRDQSLIGESDHVLYVDCDAHRGNGVASIFRDDPRVLIFDMFNTDVYPDEPSTLERVDHPVVVHMGCSSDEYLAALQSNLSEFLDAAVRYSSIAIAIYNAGTDIFERDPLGGLNVAASAVMDRDQFVVEQLQQLDIPTVVVTGGGYTHDSARLIAGSVCRLLETY